MVVIHFLSIDSSPPVNKKSRTEESPAKDVYTPEKELHSPVLEESSSLDALVVDISAQMSVNRLSLTDESTLVENALENEVELSIVEEKGKEEGYRRTSRQVNGNISMVYEKPIYVCACIESRPPIATVPPAATLYCQAVDSVGGKLVGCCLVANRKRFYRPSKKIPFMILCDSHRDRIRKHFCCPGCGLFCTQVPLKHF